MAENRTAESVNGVITDAEVSRFLFREAELLDEHRYREWYGLLSEQIDYKMPVLRSRVESDGGNELAKNMFYFDENWKSLSWRVQVLENPGTYNWAENPRSLVRRIIGNVRAEEGQPRRCAVKSNFMLYRGTAGGVHYTFLTGQRSDVVARRGDGRLCLEKRTIYLDQTMLLSQNLSFLL